MLRVVKKIKAKTIKQQTTLEEVTLKKSVAHDGRNCQVNVNFNLVLFGRKFTSSLIYEPDESVQ